MALNKKTYKDLSATQPFIVEVFGKAAIGAAGAVGTLSGKGFSVARTGAGLYTITILNGGGTAALPDILTANVGVANNSATAQFTAQVLAFVPASGTVTLVTSSAAAANVAADPANGAVLYFNLAVQNAQATG